MERIFTQFLQVHHWYAKGLDTHPGTDGWMMGLMASNADRITQYFMGNVREL